VNLGFEQWSETA